MESPPTRASIEAAFLDADLEELKATRGAVATALEHTEHLESRFTEMVGAARAASLQPLVDVLQEAERVLVAQLQRRGVTEQPSEAAGDREAEAATATPAGSWDGEIRSRQDVIRVLDKVCEYYERQEPSSPLPMLLRRAQRLATMSFLEILRELTPAGVPQAEALGGVAALGGTAGTASPDSGTPAGREGW
jgi:type VI secretion system protein ImpA